jgi:5-oxoprolinase (ATP-hydrolysing)
MKYYFAYGSNMDASQMARRCPDSKLVGPAFLNDYRVGFTIFSPRRQCGCADVVYSAGSVAPGLLYEVSDVDIESLDRYENVTESIYRRIEVRVATQDGTSVPCYTYEVVHKSPGLSPSKDYIGIMRRAAEQFSFPQEYQEFLANTKTID